MDKGSFMLVAFWLVFFSFLTLNFVIKSNKNQCRIESVEVKQISGKKIKECECVSDGIMGVCPECKYCYMVDMVSVLGLGTKNKHDRFEKCSNDEDRMNIWMEKFKPGFIFDC